MGSKTKKQYLTLDEIPILTRTIMAFDSCDQIHEIILVIPKQDRKFCKNHVLKPFGFSKKIHVVDGGRERQDSVLNGLKRVSDKSTRNKEIIILIHDGVRPFINQQLIEACIENAIEHGACIPGIKISDTIKQTCPDSYIQKTINRQFLFAAQTPQTFKLNVIMQAFAHAAKTRFSGTDDASLVEHSGGRVVVIKGSKRNIKITTREDLILAEHFLNKE